MTKARDLSVVPNQSLGFKNRIINGAMVIDQRNAGASVTITTDGTYTLDRYQIFSSSASKISVQRNAGSVTPPVGFINYLGVTSLAATSVGAADYYFIRQCIEGLNCTDLDWGTANAKTVTLSFWVRSSLTGTFGGTLENSAQNRSYPFSYTISSANTWEYKTITVAGDTTGTWLTTNGIGIMVQFGLGVGSTYSDTANAWTSKASAWSATGATSVVGTNGATFYITGVQLEVGSSATSFDYRPYGTELQLCQRYYEVARYSPSGFFGMSAVMPAGANNRFYWLYQVTKRADATVALGTGGWVNATPTIYGGSTNAEFFNANYFYASGTSGNVVLTASAEL